MRQFVADASHELRTPLTAIRGFAEYYRQRGGVAEIAGGAAALPAAGDLSDAAGQRSAGHELDPAQETRPVSHWPEVQQWADTGPHRVQAAGHDTNAPQHGSNAGRDGAGTLPRVDLDRIMRRVEQESARMSVLVEDMLLLARLDQGRPLERKPVDLAALAADAVEDFRVADPSRPVELATAGAAVVAGDDVRLRQVMANVLDNARQHTPAGTPIEVRVAEADGTATLDVTDQGPGVSPEEAQRVFERFYRGDPSRSRGSGGTGLGLSIAAAIVEAHGGRITLHNEPGHGATFTVSLPTAPPPDGEAATAEGERRYPAADVSG